MAFYNKKIDQYETQKGVYYIRDNEAFLCATDPRRNIGMAQPIKIVHQNRYISISANN